jgi:hypothetical protein
VFCERYKLAYLISVNYSHAPSIDSVISPYAFNSYFYRMGRIDMAVRSEGRELRPKALNYLPNPMDQKWYLFSNHRKNSRLGASVLDHKASEIS